jgi:hypothetical protein
LSFWWHTWICKGILFKIIWKRNWAGHFISFRLGYKIYITVTCMSDCKRGLDR